MFFNAVPLPKNLSQYKITTLCFINLCDVIQDDEAQHSIVMVASIMRLEITATVECRSLYAQLTPLLPSKSDFSPPPPPISQNSYFLS